MTETECAYGTANCTLGNGDCSAELILSGNVCGDSSQDASRETCDDGNTVTESCPYGQTSCLMCDATCQEVAGATSLCGDNVTVNDNHETCDDGAGINSGSLAMSEHCNTSCTGSAPYCGDGTVDAGYEDCDDHDNDAGDGCDATCQVESGWQCTTDNPSQCYPQPGPEFVLVSPGTFTMGSPDNEEGRWADVGAVVVWEATMSPRSDNDVERIDRRAATYDKSWLQRWYFDPIRSAMLHRMEDGLLDTPGSLLDVACGTGRLLRKAADH